MFVSIVISDLLLSLSSLILSSSKAIVEEMVTNDDNERRVMSYNPELSYKVAILSVVAYDQSHPSIVLINTCHQPDFNFGHFLQKPVTSSITSVLFMQRFRRLCKCWCFGVGVSCFGELKICDNLLMIR